MEQVLHLILLLLLGLTETHRWLLSILLLIVIHRRRLLIVLLLRLHYVLLLGLLGQRLVLLHIDMVDISGNWERHS
jgi:hypothetical protein